MDYKKFMESYYGGKTRSAAWHADGGANDERHDLDTNKPAGTPHAVHINGKKWKTFGSQSHAQNVAKKIKGATVHKEEVDLEEGLDIIARADYKINKAGKKSHKEIVFHNGSVDQEKDDELKREEIEIEEKLDPSMGAGEYIKDFQKSDAPQFKGKSKEKKRMMGIAAYMAAKKDMKEEVEIQEGESHQSKTTMKHIPNASPALKKAAKDIKPGVSGYRDRVAMLKAGGVKEETVAEAKDEKEYGYEGDMALNQLATLTRCAEMIKDMLKPDTDMPEWVQSKITLATDYIQTAADYMYSEMNEELKGKQHKIDKNKNGKIDAHDFKLLRKEELDEALDPSEIAGNPKMYDAATAKKAYYHKSASASDKESLARHLDLHHGNTEWRKSVKEDLDEAMINGREYASHGLMHPDHAAHAVHKVTGSTVDFYAHGSGDKVSGKVTKNDGKSVHIKDTSGKTHKFKVQRGLPQQQNEQAPVAPSLMKHRISVTVSDPDHTMVSKRKEKMQKTVVVTHSSNKEGAQKVGEKFYKKKGYIVHDSHHAGMVNEEVVTEERTAYEKSEENKRSADSAKKQGNMFDHHLHMADYHENLAQHNSEKGRQGVADQHAEKSEQHHEKAMKLKEETNQFDAEGNLMAEKKTYSQFVEQLLEYESDKSGVYRHTKGSYGKSYDSEDDDKPSKAEPSTVKRGRGRPAGAKSGANQKVSSGKSYGGIATHTLNLPK